MTSRPGPIASSPRGPTMAAPARSWPGRTSSSARPSSWHWLEASRSGHRRSTCSWTIRRWTPCWPPSPRILPTRGHCSSASGRCATGDGCRHGMVAGPGRRCPRLGRPLPGPRRLRGGHRGRPATPGRSAPRRCGAVPGNGSSTKGAEFDHVAVVGLDVGRFPSGRAVGTAEDPQRALEEERRLAYVAWTRARRTLTLSYDPAAPSAFLLEAFTPEELGLDERSD